MCGSDLKLQAPHMSKSYIKAKSILNKDKLLAMPTAWVTRKLVPLTFSIGLSLLGALPPNPLFFTYTVNCFTYYIFIYNLITSLPLYIVSLLHLSLYTVLSLHSSLYTVLLLYLIIHQTLSKHMEKS